MAKQIEGVYEAILSCAKKEFLEKGYKDASLRVIAQEAGTSTGSIYTRFGDKEGLFEAIVGPAAGQLTEMFLKIQKDFHNLNEDTQRAEMGKYTSEHQIDMLDLIYDHFDEFRLLLDCAEGSTEQVIISVPKKLFKRAVRRNLIRRRTREALRHVRAEYADAAGKDILMVYVANEILEYGKIVEGVRDALAKIQ